MSKPPLPYNIRTKMEDHAKRIAEMQAGEDQELEKEVLAMGFRDISQKYEMPEGGVGMRTLKNILAIPDYLGGVARTGLGEASLLAKDIREGTMSAQKGKQAADRVASAVLPFGELATPSDKYLELHGVGREDWGSLATSNLLPEKWRPERGSWKDISGRGAAGLGLDILTSSPTALLSNAFGFGSAKQLAQKSLPKAAPGKTAAQYTEELAQMLEPKGNMQKAKDFTRSVGEYFANLNGKTGKALYDFGSREANEATEAVTKRPFSDALLENGSKSFRAKGIRQDVKNILADTTRQADLLKNPPAHELAQQLSLYEGPFQGKSIGMPTTNLDDIVNPVFKDKRILEALDTPGQTGPTRAALEQLKQKFRDTAEYVAPGEEHSRLQRYLRDQGMAENLAARAPEANPLMDGPDMNFGVDPATGKELIPEPLPAGEQLFKKPAADVKSVYKIPPQQVGMTPASTEQVTRSLPRLKKVIDTPGKPAGKKWVDVPGVGKVQVDTPAVPPTYKDVPEFYDYVEDVHVPGEPIMSEPRLGATHFPRESAPYTRTPDILDAGAPPYTPHESDRLATSMQGLADKSGTYGQPTTFWHPSQQNVAQVDANRIEGWMANQIANRARAAAQQNLDEFSPGKGGELWRIYKDKAALREGAPFMEQQFTETGKRGASTGLRAGFRAGKLSGSLLNALDGSGDASLRALGQLLMSPAQRYLGGPALRSKMVNEIYDSEYGDPKRNPWGAIKKWEETK